jgi:hypothetical protein
MKKQQLVMDTWDNMDFEDKLLIVLFGRVRHWEGYKDVDKIEAGDQAAQMCPRCQEPMVYIEGVCPKTRCNRCGARDEMALFMNAKPRGRLVQ